MKAVVTGLDEALVRDVVRPVAPVASVYLGPPPPEALSTVVRDIDLRAQSLLRRLREAGAARATVAAVEQFLAGQPPKPVEMAIFAAGDEVSHVVPVPGAGTADLAMFGAPAHAVPVLAWLQRRPAYVSVVADRAGADITVVPRGSVEGHTSVVEGPDDEIERNAPGGWSQPRYQRRAEDSWQHNAARVAEATAAALRQVGAGLLVVSGDVRAVQLLLDHLPNGVRKEATIRQVTGSRHEDGSRAERLAATARAVEEYAAAQTQAVLTRFVESRAPGGYAVEGAAPTLRALAGSRVATLLVAPVPDDDRLACFGAEAAEVSHPDETTLLAGLDLRTGPLVDVAVRAALLTDATVCVLDPAIPGRPAEDIGALCRFR